MPNPEEAREAAWRTWLGESMHGESGFRFAWDARGRYDEQRIAELVEVASEIRPLQATGPDWWRCALCGHKERQLTRDPAAMHDANCAWLALRAALAALEEAGSDG